MGALVAFVYIFGGFDSGVNRDYCVLRVTLTLLQTQFSALTEANWLTHGKRRFNLFLQSFLSIKRVFCWVFFFPSVCGVFFVLRFFIALF